MVGQQKHLRGGLWHGLRSQPRGVPSHWYRISAASGAAVSTSLALLVETVLLFYCGADGGSDSTASSCRVSHSAHGATTGPRQEIALSIVPAQSPHAFKVEFRAPEELHDIKDEWRDLCARAVEPNVFFEPDVALNAIPVFGKNVVAALVWIGQHPRHLVGLMLVRNTRRNGITPVLHGFTNPFSGLSLPLIDRDMAEPVIGALLDHIRDNPKLPKTILIPLVAEEGPLAAAFDAVLAQRHANFAVFDRHRRALVAPVHRPRKLFQDRTEQQETQGAAPPA